MNSEGPLNMTEELFAQIDEINLSLSNMTQFTYLLPVWQNLAFEDRIRMASQGNFRSSKALLTNQELRLKQQHQQIVDGL